jgi:23S rRNA (uridine2552-2'-O)-methyltransferase
MGSLRDRRRRHDVFFRKARESGYAARSVFKLEDLDRRFRLLHPGDRVLDLGCRPGSWLKYVCQMVGPHGRAVGLDRKPLDSPVSGARLIVGDVFTVTDEELLGPDRAFDLVLSDMAPDTTGIRATDQARSVALVAEAQRRAERLLAPGGGFVAKIFQGPDVAAVRKQLQAHFSEVHLVKPEASRAASTELYLVAEGFGGAAA